MKIAINGFGRIGKCLLRAIFEENLQDKIEIIKINSSCENLEMEAHLLKYDTVHGIFPYKVSFDLERSKLIIEDKFEITFTSSKKTEDINWNEVDILFECTGAFLTEEKCKIHLERGAKKVLISAPAKDSSIKTILFKVNDENLKKDDKIISIGSCTTNCLAPFVKVINDKIGIKNGFATTVHSYTNDQNIVDGYHKKDFRRARAAACSIIPTSSGVSKAIGQVIPSLKGKLSGSSVRVPVPNVSMIDFCFTSSRNTNAQEINTIFEDASKFDMKNVIICSKIPLVSCDFIHTSESCILDNLETSVVDDNFCRVCLWYDNEWAFCLRMLDLSIKMNFM